MAMWKRILLSAGVLMIDLGVVILPLTALFLIYIFIWNPPWFREFLDRFDQGYGEQSG
jgi:hypothetical protein